jgi:hypothetical protein
MTHLPRIDRRAFVVGTAAIGSGLALGFDIPFGGPGVVRAADGAPEVNAWVVIRPDDTVVIRIARFRNGARHADGPRSTHRRRTRMRLEQGHNGISDAGPKRSAQAGVGQLQYRRQHRHSRVATICTQGRRGCPRDADSGGGK